MNKGLIKLLLVAAAIAAAAIAAIPIAQAGTTPRNHAVNATIISNSVETRGQVTVDAGIVKDKSLGQGAGLLFIKSAGGNKLSITAKVWYDAGVQKLAGTVTFTVNPDGTATFNGNAHYTGGTRKFRGITGNVKADGTVATDGLTTTHVRGNAKY
jgi:hypothetical protein